MWLRPSEASWAGFTPRRNAGWTGGFDVILRVLKHARTLAGCHIISAFAFACAALAQEVTVKDLAGCVVEMRIMFHQTVVTLRSGKTSPGTVEKHARVAIGADGMIE